MSMRTRSIVAAAIVALTLIAITAPALAVTTEVARWKFDDPKLPKDGPVADTFGLRPGAVGDTTQTLIKRRENPVTGSGGGTYSYYFKGWREGWSTGTPCPSLTPNGALVTVNDPGTDADGGGGTFDPKGRAFEFTVNLRGQSETSGPPIPISCGAGGSTSLNVLQQGLFNNAGGMYKLQIAGDGTPSCLFQDNAVLSQGTSAPHQLKVDSTTGSVYNRANWFRVTCRLARDASGVRAEITVKNLTTGTPAVTTVEPWTGAEPFGNINPCTTSSTSCVRLTKMYIGKKPGSTDPRDAFAGWLDNISFSYIG